VLGFKRRLAVTAHRNTWVSRSSRITALKLPQDFAWQRCIEVRRDSILPLRMPNFSLRLPAERVNLATGLPPRAITTSLPAAAPR